MKIKTKITLNFTLIVGAILLLFSIIIYYFSDYYREEQFYSRLKDKALTTATLLFEVEEVDSVLLKIINSADQTLLFEEKVIIYDKFYNKIYESREEIIPTYSIEDFEKLKQQDMKRMKSQGREILFMKIREKGDEYFVFASAYDKYGYSKINNLLQILMICLLTSISLLILTGRYFARKLLDPISNIIQQVEIIDVQNISTRVDGGKNRDEISALASTFNNMLERLEEAFIIQKNFVSNASHELRTPLTAIIGQIDVALLKDRNTREYVATLQSIKEDLSGFVDLSNKLLLLAQTDAKLPTFSIVEFRIDEVLWQARHDIMKKDNHFDIHISFDNQIENEDLLIYKGSEPLLKTAFMNLMENGCKYSENNTAEVVMYADHGKIQIKFVNDSKTIQDDEIKMIFNPFFRASNSSGIPGHGIGLALVRNIISIHNGEFEFCVHEHNKFCFQITFFINRIPGTIISY